MLVAGTSGLPEWLLLIGPEDLLVEGFGTNELRLFVTETSAEEELVVECGLGIYAVGGRLGLRG